FALAYLVAGPPRLGKRIWQLLAGGAALLVAAGWWVALVMLTPADARPYIGGSTDNSILQLTFGYNGFGRLDGNEAGSVGFGNGTGPQFGGPASPVRAARRRAQDPLLRGPEPVQFRRRVRRCSGYHLMGPGSLHRGN